MAKLPPHVVSIGKTFIRLKVPREKFWNAARNLGAVYRLFPPSFGIPFDNETEQRQILASLRDIGFVFLRDAAWDCPAAVMEDLVEKAQVSPGFTTIEIADAEHWTLHKNEKRPLTRPFFAKK
jgi:hypothetical protein